MGMLPDSLEANGLAYSRCLANTNDLATPLALTEAAASCDATIPGIAPFQWFGYTCLPTHRLDLLHSACSFNNTTAMYFK